METGIETVGIDPEWLELISQARQIGLSIDEVKAFINAPAENEHFKRDAAE